VAERSLWAGLDTGADTSCLSVIDGNFCPVLEESLRSDPTAIAKVLHDLGDVILKDIAVEAAASSIHLAHGLRDQGFKVSLFQTGQVSRYLRMRRNKTDSSDARGLAELAKLRLPSMTPVHLKSPNIQRLRTKLQFRHRLTFQRVACEGMIRSLIRLHGGRLKRSQSGTQISDHVQEELDRLRNERGVDLSEEIMPLLDLAVSMRRFLAQIDKDLKRLAQDHPVCARFLAIPGIGPISAISFYTAVEDPWRFKRASDVGAYLGLTPIVLQSGVSLRHGRISKMGNKLTRSHLVNSASVMFAGKIKDCPLKEWGLAVAERAGKGKARIAVARRLAVIMLAVWKSGHAYDGNLAAPKVYANIDVLTAPDRIDPAVGLEA
jgi:transposase